MTKKATSETPNATGGGPWPAMDCDVQQEIYAAEREWEKALEVWAMKKAEAKEAKDGVDAAAERVRELICFARTGQHNLPFSGLLGEVQVSDEHREIRLEHVDPPLHPGTVAKLELAEIETIGDLVDYLNTGQKITSIEGIGKAGAEKIRRGLSAFLSKTDADDDA